MARAWLTPECLEAAEGRPPAGRSIRVFRGEIVERLAMAHPVFPGAWGLPMGVWMLWRHASLGGGAAGAAAWVGVGWAGFGLFEYLLHRFVFHRRFAPTPRGRLEAFLTHGYHHAYPADPMRLVMPPLIAWPLAVMVWAAERAALGSQAAAAAFAGTLAGYVTYDWTHYYAHHAHPRSRLGRWLKTYHQLHHHDRAGGRFGVSHPLWDMVFGTARGGLRRSLRQGGMGVM